MPPLLPLSLTRVCPIGTIWYSPGCGREHCEILELLQQLEDMENAHPLLGLSCFLPIQSHGAVGMLMPDIIQLNKSLRT